MENERREGDKRGRKGAPDSNFDILYVFFRHHMQKPRPFEDFMTIFCKIHQHSYFLIFPTSISLNISSVERILFFEVLIIFNDFLNTRKGDPCATECWHPCATEMTFRWRTRLHEPQKAAFLWRINGRCATVFFSTVHHPPSESPFLVFKKITENY